MKVMVGNIEVDLETRKCCECSRTFRCMPTSKQQSCSRECIGEKPERGDLFKEIAAFSMPIPTKKELNNVISKQESRKASELLVSKRALFQRKGSISIEIMGEFLFVGRGQDTVLHLGKYLNLARNFMKTKSLILTDLQIEKLKINLKSLRHLRTLLLMNFGGSWIIRTKKGWKFTDQDVNNLGVRDSYPSVAEKKTAEDRREERAHLPIHRYLTPEPLVPPAPVAPPTIPASPINDVIKVRVTVSNNLVSVNKKKAFFDDLSVYRAIEAFSLSENHTLSEREIKRCGISINGLIGALKSEFPKYQWIVPYGYDTYKLAENLSSLNLRFSKKFSKKLKEIERLLLYF